MSVIEWEGEVRVHVGEISRAGQLDLWVMYAGSTWFENDKADSDLDNVRRVMETDSMVAAAATRRIEICKKGKWVTLPDGKSETIQSEDGDVFTLSSPPTYEQVNACPRRLGDAWVKEAVERNGGLSLNLNFFTSLTPENGKVNKDPTSEPPPSSTPKTATS